MIAKGAISLGMINVGDSHACAWNGMGIHLSAGLVMREFGYGGGKPGLYIRPGVGRNAKA